MLMALPGLCRTSLMFKDRPSLCVSGRHVYVFMYRTSLTVWDRFSFLFPFPPTYLGWIGDCLFCVCNVSCVGRGLWWWGGGGVCMCL